jgi:SAM-dependent methyltransferase
LQPGWRCLELGAGAGSIVRWLADATGPTGSVVAVDIDTRHLVELPSNVEVRNADIRADDLGFGYDLIHARCLLQHLPERSQIMERLVTALRPGGCLVCEETTASLSSGPVVERFASDPEVVGAFYDHALRVAEAAGIDFIRHAYRLPTTLEALGLRDVDCQMFTPIGRGGDPLARFLLTSVRNAAALSAKFAFGGPEMDARLEQWLTNPKEIVIAPPLISAWGFKA